MALRTARIHRVRGRPPLLAAGIKSLIHFHSSSVRSLGYVCSFISLCYTTHEDFSDSLLDAPSASRRETPGEPGRHDGKIAREFGVVAILRAPLVELRHGLRQREAGQPLAVRSLPGTQQALGQLTHVLQQEALVFRPLAGPTSCRGNSLWGHSSLLPRWRRPRPAPPDTVG